MSKNYNKYSAIIALVIILAFAIHSIFNGGEKVYDYTSPQPLQLEETEIDTTGYETKISFTDNNGYISQLYADDKFIYYLSEPVVNDVLQDTSYGVAYIKKMDKETGVTQIVREFSNVGKFNISKIVYTEDYYFISATIFDGDNQKDTILKMDTKTGDIDVIYETTSVTGGAYKISSISNDYTDKYLIWTEVDPYTEKNTAVNEYKLYNIQKDEIITRPFEEKSYQGLYTNPSMHENRILYNILGENGDNVIICKSVNGEEYRKINTPSINFATGFYNNDYVVWVNPVWRGVYGDNIGSDVYLFDFAGEEQFLVDENALDLKLYDDYIVTVNKEYVNLIDYRDNKKYKYILEENQEVTQKLVNVTDNYIIMNEYFDDENKVVLTYKTIAK